MKRRTLLQGLAMLAAFPLTSACSRDMAAASITDATSVTPLTKLPETWRTLVSDPAYKVLFEEDTERPNSSELNHEHHDGHYVCAACYLPLFESAHKFESGTGWPSFTQPIAGHVGLRRDFKLILPRTEYHCARCTGHQGHLFTDGPPPRKERWCNNGLALRFIPKDKPLPALRS